MAKAMEALLSVVLLLFCCGGQVVRGEFDYRAALSKSILFLEAQRSGKLPQSQRVKWRGDSGLTDGHLQNVDLVGGYYDAGDNVKYGLPMAFTITTLAWGTLDYGKELKAAGEIQNARDAIRWGTDYFLKAGATPDQLWVQVGDPQADHNCWERPEDMDTPRSLYKIDKDTPGSEIAAETAAALAASSIVFRFTNPRYSHLLLQRSQSLFSFADRFKGTYGGECPFYCSVSGYNDELLWAASWLYRATKSPYYSNYIIQHDDLKAYVNEFNWDLKYAGIQVLLTDLYFQGEAQFSAYRSHAERFVCSLLPGSPIRSVKTTPGGLLYVRDGANTQYVTSAAFLLARYSDLLSAKKQTLSCGNTLFKPSDVMGFAKLQIDYLLGRNPLGISYMVGYGSKNPRQPHHRGASVVSIHQQPTKIKCIEGFMNWFHKDSSNPNTLIGAIVGGPDKYDRFVDLRTKSSMLEPTTYINSPLVGVLAKLYRMTRKTNRQF
ncbi:hypothetical protein SUGI_1394490 [Cryptomeria japonica]|uniref:cellulase n=1 Tax=Cryptomeria japonica TaxID=3369 RepID=A0AAD3NQN5_CRYJA|nr:endoglucanase 16-like [Cryptomeria japonica]XP_057832604.2 endoglucanase 16-like [Cryptomeria japonica]GLJ57965.1 hypothetical protein SUGI_1394480 [Cryptomeria japonica]GLJ57966.1 hypothetical protein SUGI_1394490 [Cryptomeria japonica]